MTIPRSLFVLIVATQVALAADPLTLIDIGSPPIAASVIAEGGGYNLTASGNDIGGNADQFAFYYQLLSGDFDMRVRVEALSLSDAFAKAGLVAREGLSAGARSAAVLATPSVGGTLFASRIATNGAATSGGAFPVNYPSTWLRLRRVGNQFTGYASYDGQLWSQLGTVSIGLPTDIYFGLAACSHNNSTATTAALRDLGEAVGATVGNPAATVEPLGPSSRKTGIVITEIMYKPARRDDGRVIDYVEIFNSNPFFEDISGWRLSGDIDYKFPPNTILQGGAFLVIAKVPADVQAVYGISNVTGPYTNNLTTDSLVRLRNQVDHIFLEVEYDNSSPWPVAADGTGHSLALLRPSYGEGQPQAWGISDLVGGSPGRMDAVRGHPLRNVVINEFLANTDAPIEDFIELYNHSNQDVDLSGCILTDDADTNRFVIAAGTMLPARGFISFNQSQLGFGLNSGGEKIFFWNPDRTRVLDSISFEAQANGVSSGRFPDGAASIYPLQERSSGAANTNILIRDIVINEIMYKPISTDQDEEYVELYNKGASAVDLSGWRFISGINYTFPSNTTLAADGYLVVAKNVTNLLAKHPGVLNPANTLGNFAGNLANRGERLALGMPDISYTTNSQNQVSTNTVYVVVDEVTYGTGGAWGNWANEGGSSLELIDSRADHRLALNWTDSDETAKAPWTTIQFTGPMDLGGQTPNFFEVLALGEGEYLLDDAEVIPLGSTNYISPANSTFESGIGSWLSRGTHIRSSLETSGGFGGGQCLHIRASARGDAIANRNLCPIPVVPAGTTTLRAKVRWLRGWPELLLRLHGNYIEAVDRLALPSNLGTPGAPNSRARANNGPAISQMTHSPVLPAASENVVVTARVHDPDGVGSLLLKYRVDPAASYSTNVMVDNGTAGDAIAGDGVFSGTIPGQSANTLVAFYIEATDTAAAQSVYPLGAPQFEGLVRFGDPVVSSGFGTYRQWLTANAATTWSTRPVLSNERIFGTFVYGNFRAIYNMSAKYSGSPYHQGFTSPVSSGCHYSIELPLDDILLGTENFNKIHAPGNGPFDDNISQREQICYWFARQMNLPWNYRRFVNMFVNGNRRGGTTHLMEDTETPGNDVVESRFPNNPDGHLYKLQPWFEQDDVAAGQSQPVRNESWCLLVKHVSGSPPQHKKARYRWNYLVRAASGTANDYDPVFTMIDAANSSTANATAYFNAMNNVVNLEQWMRIFSVCHAAGDWDHFGTQNSQNMYGYVPQNSRWELMIWDFNIVLGNSGSWTEGQNLFLTTPSDPVMPNLYNNPYSRRAYLRALKELASGPMAAANVQPLMDAKYNAMLASGINIPAQNLQNVKNWIANARVNILNTVAGEDVTALTVTTNSITTNNNLVIITGTAPVEAATIRVNGIDYPVIWTSPRNFILRVPLHMAINSLVLQGYNLSGNPIANMTNLVNARYTGLVVPPQDSVVFSEIMYNPRVEDASYVEIYNRSSSFSFDLSGWRINGLDLTFPSGSIIEPRQAVVVARNAYVFRSTYGSTLPVLAEFDGNVDSDGETLTLIKPGATEVQDVVIDRVRYEARSPWPDAPEGSGIALQVIDPARDNARVSNWSDGTGWKQIVYTGNLTALTNQFRLYLGSIGEIYIDDIVLVAGAVAEAGPNLIRNGDFEGPLLTSQGGPWNYSHPNLSNTVITTTVKRTGNSSLRLVHLTAGPSTWLNQNGVVIPAAGQYTVSLWYLPITNNAALTPYFSATYRTNAPVRLAQATPAAGNSSFAVLPPYPPLWLNEVQPNNVSGIRDGSNTAEPWIELYNAGTNAVSLAGMFLTDNYGSNLTQWAFPIDATINPQEFKIIWADGDPEETTTNEWHTSFRLHPSSGTLALTRLLGTDAQIVDYLTYDNVGPNLSYGDYPDGQPFNRTIFYTVTPGATNEAAAGAIFINEWLAGNQAGLVDPADGQPEDWIELFNPNNYAIDLNGYYLSDTTNILQYRIPNGYTIPAHGFLLVWADGETGQNSSNRIDLHASFALSRTGEAITLFDPEGKLVDSVVFGNQTNDVSEGRFPDGSPNRYFMTTVTPRANNFVSGVGENTPPSIGPIARKYVTLGKTLSFTVNAVDVDEPPQTLSFSLTTFPSGATIDSESGLFNWTPSPAQAPSTNSISVRVEDNGVPPMSDTQGFTVYVVRPPQITLSKAGGVVSLSFSTVNHQAYQVEYNDALRETGWEPLGALVQGDPDGSTATVEDNVGSQSQRFYRIRLVD
jgi:hypothetical protein